MIGPYFGSTVVQFIVRGAEVSDGAWLDSHRGRVVVILEPQEVFKKFWPVDGYRRAFAVSAGWRERVQRWQRHVYQRAMLAQEADQIAQRMQSVDNWAATLVAASERIGPLNYSLWSHADARRWVRWLRRAESQSRRNKKKGNK